MPTLGKDSEEIRIRRASALADEAPRPVVAEAACRAITCMKHLQIATRRVERVSSKASQPVHDVMVFDVTSGLDAQGCSQQRVQVGLLSAACCRSRASSVNAS